MPGPPPLDAHELERRFPVDTKAATLDLPADVVMSHAFHLAVLLVDLCPAGRELSTAVTKLEEAVMWAAKAIDTA